MDVATIANTKQLFCRAVNLSFKNDSLLSLKCDWICI